MSETTPPPRTRTAVLTPEETLTTTLQATPLGHATVLLEWAGWRLLTDPVLSERIGVSLGRRVFGLRRRQPPALSLEELPPLDLILLSHAHLDHTDLPTLEGLPASATAIAHHNNGDLIRRFSQSHTLRWEESLSLEAPNRPLLRVTAIPSKHWGARVVVDRWRGWGGFLLETPDLPSPYEPSRPFALLFSGDTAQTDIYARLREERQGAGVDLALMPIGGYKPWIVNHCSPEQAWSMAVHDLGALHLLPIHYDTFPVSHEPPGEASERLQVAAQQDKESQRLVGLDGSFTL